MKIAIVGAGWAGLAAAVEAMSLGHVATVFEASHALGGRARGLNGKLPDGTPVKLDNGQHILIGAYSESLRLLRQVGINPATALLRLPLTLKFPDETGLQFPQLPSPFNALFGILAARGWSLGDKALLLQAAAHWRWRNFSCKPSESVAQLCAGLSPAVLQGLIEPLCVSALNTPAGEASGQVFLRVMKDSLFAGAGSSDLLLPRVDLSALFPQAACQWIEKQGAEMRLAERIQALQMVPPQGESAAPTWQVNGETFDAVILALPPTDAVRLLASLPEAQAWCQTASALRFEAITTVYAFAPMASLPRPMLALKSTAGPNTQAPAQFVFDRGQLGGPPGLLAFVVSASDDERGNLQAQVLEQAKNQLGLDLQAVQTVVEKRATFACTPGLQRPPMVLAKGLLACGDYIEGPYPATLEGAVRSGVAAARALQPGLSARQNPAVVGTV
jgi:hydroxysqualene dehydroxylase